MLYLHCEDEATNVLFVLTLYLLGILHLSCASWWFKNCGEVMKTIGQVLITFRWFNRKSDVIWSKKLLFLLNLKKK